MRWKTTGSHVDSLSDVVSAVSVFLAGHPISNPVVPAKSRFQQLDELVSTNALVSSCPSTFEETVGAHVTLSS